MQTFTDKTLTAANSVLLFRAKGYNDSFVPVMGYAADNAFSFGEGAIGETVMGVDGFQSGAFTPYEVDFNIQLQANSPSRDHFDNVVKKMRTEQETLPFEFHCTIPSIKKRYIAKGFMVSTPGGTNAKKTLEAVTFSFKLGEITVEDTE